jgi:hypothetical protein
MMMIMPAPAKTEVKGTGAAAHEFHCMKGKSESSGFLLQLHSKQLYSNHTYLYGIFQIKRCWY